MDSARGRFVAFIDDDDDVDDEYLPVLCNVIEGHPEIDCIGFRGQMTWAGQSREPMIHSLVYKQHENVGGAFGFRVYLRPPNHLNPTRREIAQRYRFADVNFGEDTVRADQMARDGAFEREYFIGDRVLYYYLFEPSRGDTLRPVNCK